MMKRYSLDIQYKSDDMGGVNIKSASMFERKYGEWIRYEDAEHLINELHNLQEDLRNQYENEPVGELTYTLNVNTDIAERKVKGLAKEVERLIKLQERLKT